MFSISLKIGRYLRKIFYPFHRIRNIIEYFNLAGISNSGKELLLTLAILGELPLNYTIIPRIISSTLKTKMRSKANIYEQIRVLSSKELIYVDYSENTIKPTVKGLIIAGKFIVLTRMIYTVPMSITLLLMLTIFRSLVPYTLLYAASFIAIIHYICNMVILFITPSRWELNSRKINNLVRLVPETLPIVLFFIVMQKHLLSLCRIGMGMMQK